MSRSGPLAAPLLRRQVAVAVVCAGALGVLWLAVQHVASVPVLDLTRDPSSVLDGPWYAGTISTLGVALWLGASITALLSSVAAGATREERGFLRWFGAIGLLLAVDDALLLHEVVGPELVGEGIEKAVYALYALALVVGVVRYWQEVLACPILLLGLGSMGISVVIDALDLAPSALGLAPTSIEDYFKVLGITLWTVGILLQSVAAIRRPVAAAPVFKDALRV